MPGTTIIGSGHFVPGEPIPNDALGRVMQFMARVGSAAGAR